MKNKYKTIAFMFIYILVIGGIMGLMKIFIPSLEHFDYRYILTKTSTFEAASKPAYVIIYSVVMAILELMCAVVIIKFNRVTIFFTIGVLSINAVGCLVAVCLGDLLAIISLIFRIVVIIYFSKLLKML